jgi:hypothetical protein
MKSFEVHGHNMHVEVPLLTSQMTDEDIKTLRPGERNPWRVCHRSVFNQQTERWDLCRAANTHNALFFVQIQRVLRRESPGGNPLLPDRRVW